MKRAAALVAVLGALACACQRQTPVSFKLAGGKSPNLLLISIDTLRADHLGCYAGAAVKTTPNIDRLAAESTLFEQASAPVPATLPALASLLTGRYPGGQPVRTNLGRMAKDVPVLAEILAAAGYNTAAFYGNSLLDRASGLDRGFRSYTSFVPLAGASDARGVDFVQGWLESGPPPQPWFLWVHFMDPHGPYDSPPSAAEGLAADALADKQLPFSATNYGLGVIPKYQQLDDLHGAREYRRRYTGEIQATDAQVGRLLALLDSSGLRESTLVVLTADHGESLGEHDYYFQHGWFPYEESLHIPLIVHAPGEGAGSRRIAAPVSLVDVLPTLLGGLAIAAPEGIEGRDLRPSFGGASVEAPVFAVTAYLNQMSAVRQGNWKLVHTPRPPEPPPGDPWAQFYARSESYTLFDLVADPGETRDQSTAAPDRLRAMRERLRPWEEKHGIPMGRESATPLDPATRERLKALGYGS